MNLLKSFYISIYLTLLMVAIGYSAFELNAVGLDSAWPGILIATVPTLGFFIRMFIASVPRTSANLNLLFVFALAGAIAAVLMSANAEQRAFAYALGWGLGVVGLLLYVYWYSRLGRTSSEALLAGQALPSFTLLSSTGEQWQSGELANHPSLMLFYRGNWCPLCMAQIKEVAAHYQQLESMGVNVYLVSPQPESHTQSLAEKFEVNYHFMVDKGNQAAKQLGIDAQHGTPKGMEALGYASDTVMPTAILTDAQGKIIFTDQTDNYRVRPEPETFIGVFQQHGISAAQG